MFIFPDKYQISLKNAFIISIIFLLVYTTFIVIFQDYKIITNTVSIYLIPIVNTFTLIILYYTFKLFKANRNGYYYAWLFIFISQIFWVLGDVFWAFYATNGGLEDLVLVPYILRTTFLCLGLIIFPKPRIDKLKRMKNVTEIGMVLVTVTMIFWSFLIHPLLSSSAINYTILIFYTLLHFALVFSIISLFIYYLGNLRKVPVSLILASASFQVIAAMFFGYEILLNTFPGGGFGDVFWVMAGVSMGLAGLVQIKNKPPEVIENLSDKFTLFKSTSDFNLASLMAGLAYIIVLWSYYNDQSIFTYLIIGAGVLVGLVITRQILTYRIINKSHQEIEKAEKEIKASLKEKEVLIREIHHRVKNNMQIISSLLNLQIIYSKNQKTIDVLRESQSRIKTMAIIHESLYRSDSLSRINFKEYVDKLVNNIFQTYRIGTGSIKINLEIGDVYLNLDTAIPCGLIINELVTNSIKYAFPQHHGKITIKTKFIAHKLLELIIADDGIGLPDTIDYRNTNSLGLQIVNNLVKQIDAKIELDRSHGTEFRLIFEVK